MVDAKEKAEMIFNHFYDGYNFDETYSGSKRQSISCARFVITQILNELHNVDCSDKTIEYWEEVEKQLNLFKQTF